jgi:hypothetical protein
MVWAASSTVAAGGIAVEPVFILIDRARGVALPGAKRESYPREDAGGVNCAGRPSLRRPAKRERP